jgi:hypothetical protein
VSTRDPLRRDDIDEGAVCMILIGFAAKATTDDRRAAAQADLSARP